MNPLARAAGSAMALTAVALAAAAAAQGPISSPPSGGGALAWLFAAFVAAAIAGVFLVVLWLVRGPAVRPPDRPAGAARSR
jgi:hypothetical protein